MHAHRLVLREVKLLLQLCGNLHGSIFGLDQSNAAELRSCAGDQASRERLGVQAVLLKERVQLEVCYALIWNVGYENVLLHCEAHSAVAIPTECRRDQSSAVRLTSQLQSGNKPH